MGILDKVRLNDTQREAVRHIEGPLLILAGAGSGKTRVITFRTIYMIEQGINPDNILCLTFTNKAAREMSDRIQTNLGKDAKAPRVSTFHSLGAWIMRKEAAKLGFNTKLNIFDTADQKQAIVEVLRDLQVNYDDDVIEQVASQIHSAKNTGTFPDEMPESDPMERAVKRIYTLYQDSLKQFNAVDFDDLILRPLELFQKRPDVFERLRAKFQYLMIDEYQDTNRCQYSLARALTGKERNLAVVGDDDQSIYGWRGADIRNILDFEKDFPGAKTVKLEKNYRSQGFILDAANAVIKNNEQRKDKTLLPDKDRAEKICVFNCENAPDEARKIADDILLRKMRSSRPWKEFCVLTRTHGQVRFFETAFDELDIPYHVASRLDFYDRKEIKDTLAYLKILNSPSDDISLLRVINYPRRGIGPASLSALKKRSAAEGISLLMSCRLTGEDEGNTDLGRELRQLSTLITNYGEDFKGPGMGDKLREFVREIGISDEIIKEKGDEKNREKKLAALEQMSETMNGYSKKTKNASLSDWLLKLQLHLSGGDEDEEFAENSVRMLTIHAAKGLEFPVVYIAGVEEGMLPFVRSESSTTDISEERRLAYVAITRAQESLTLSWCRERTRKGNSYECVKSRYLKEIPAELLQENSAAAPMSGDEFFSQWKKNL